MKTFTEIGDLPSALDAMLLRDKNEQSFRWAMIRLQAAVALDASVRGFVFIHRDEGGTAECVVKVEPDSRLRWKFGYMNIPSLNRGCATVMKDCLFIDGSPDLMEFMQELRSCLATTADVDVVQITGVPEHLVSGFGPELAKSGFDVSRRYQVSGMTILETK